MTTVRVCERAVERACVGERCGTALELLEVVFVEAHTVELERFASDEFGQGVRVLLGIGGVLDELRRDRVEILHVSLIEGDVFLDRFLRYAGELRDGKRAR